MMRGWIIAVSLLALSPAAPAGAVTATGTFTATVVRPIALTKTQDLTFGTIVKPSSGTATVTLTATSGTPTRTVTGGTAVALGSTTFTDARFSVSGEGAQAFTLTIPASVTLTNTAASGGTISVTTSNDAGCTTACTLSGSLGAAGSKGFDVGGAFQISNTTNTGKYTGSFTVVASYN